MKSELLKRALSGDRFQDLNIIDSHCHMGRWFSYYFPEAGADEMLHDADLVGVERLCIAPHASLSCDYKLGNQQVYSAAQKYPNRIWGLLLVNGNAPDEIKGEFDRYYSSEHFAGVKLHPSLHKYNVAGDNISLAYDIVKQRGGFILSHSWEGCPYASMSFYEEVIKAYPTIPFIFAHAGGVNEGVEKSIRLVNSYENAYLDTSGFEFSDTWLVDIVKKADNSKILYGSDIPFHDIRGGILRILLADMDDSIKKLILGGNFRKMAAFNPKKYTKV